MTAHAGSHVDTTDGRAHAAAAERSVLVVAVQDRAAIVATGKDTVSWLNGLVTCDLAKRAPGDGAYGLLVEKKGKLRADLFLVPRRGDGEGGTPGFALFVPAAKRDEVLGILDHHLIMEDVELAPADLALFCAHGPEASALVTDASLGTHAGRLDLLGTGGALVAGAVEDRDALAAKLAEAAAARSGALVDDAAFEAVRIEAGLPRFGVEVDDTLYPQEASLEKLAVSFSKGCYLGQEVVYMLENRGHVKRKLVVLDVEGEGAPRAGDEVTTPDGAAIGDVRSGAIGPRKGTPVAIAMVKWAQAKPGTELRVAGRVAKVREPGLVTS